MHGRTQLELKFSLRADWEGLTNLGQSLLSIATPQTVHLGQLGPPSGMFFSSDGRQLRVLKYCEGSNTCFTLGSYDEADHPFVRAEFNKARQRFFDDEVFWQHDMRCKLAVHKGLPPPPWKIWSRHRGVSYEMVKARWRVNFTLNGVQILLGSWATDGTKEERWTKDHCMVVQEPPQRLVVPAVPD
jgi:hypothetical protein